jgi:hypothetical protein
MEKKGIRKNGNTFKYELLEKAVASKSGMRMMYVLQNHPQSTIITLKFKCFALGSSMVKNGTG